VGHPGLRRLANETGRVRPGPAPSPVHYGFVTSGIFQMPRPNVAT